MLALSRWKIILVALSVAFGLVFTLPNLLPSGALPKWAPQQRLNLGLDLQGGSYLLLEVDTAALTKERLTNLGEDIRTKLHSDNIDFSGLGIQGAVVNVRITDPTKVQAAYEMLNSSLGERLLTGGRDITIQNKPDQTIQVAFVPEAAAAASRDAVSRSIEIIRKRIDALGTKEPLITQQGSARIVVEAPGESDPEKLKAVIGKTAKLTFQMVDLDVSPQDVEAAHIPPDDMMAPSDDGYAPAYVLKRRAVVTGEMLTAASASHSSQDNSPDINFAFNSQGASRFAQATAQNIGKPFAIVLDGRVISAPRINTAITGGSGEITGHFTEESAHQLALLLKSGALPAPLNIVEQHTVGAELGADAVKAGQISVAIGAVMIFAFIVLAYGLFGIFAAIALVVNGLMIVGAMSLTQATLTLPGIAGLVLTLAVAVDANVLIYERMRDEVRAGRAPMAAADAGFSRALVTIIDANVTTLVAAIIMFQFGSGPVKGFAWTLFIGVITSVFTAVLISQVLIGWWFRTFRPKKLPIYTEGRGAWPMIKLLPQKTHVRFVRLARVFATLSIIAVVATTIGFFKPGLNLGIDFKGGTVLEMQTPGRAVDLARVRGALNNLNLGDVQVQMFGRPDDAVARFQTPTGADPNATVQRVKAAISQAAGQVTFSRTDVVGPEVSDELKISGAGALLAAIGLMLIYIWFRFELQFGLGAVVALFHDVTLSFGLIILLRLEFSLNVIAALLTIIGYSMNDTVVVFDRLRENRRKYKRMPLRELIDLSVNETLSRTVITGVTALLALSGLAVFGGESLRPLSIVLLFGIVIGTYSSIYVASPIILLWGAKRDDQPATPIAPQPARP
ncbi:MAG TPA: protein translocase subunit SecD [Caulobacteraceae bacterium]|jgi:SecD/SecF fusion protein|nr:protein translocase subunit SecD [Caulobacteraceae bacterium]